MAKKTSQQSYYNGTQLLAPRAPVAKAERETKQITCFCDIKKETNILPAPRHRYFIQWSLW